MKQASFSSIDLLIAKNPNKVFETPFFRSFYQRQLSEFQAADNELSRFTISAQTFCVFKSISLIDGVWDDTPIDLYRVHYDLLGSFFDFSLISEGVVRQWLRDNMQPATFFHMISQFMEKEGKSETVNLFDDTFKQIKKIQERKFDLKKTDKFRWRLREFHDYVSQFYLEKTTENIPFSNVTLPEPITIKDYVINQPKNTVELAVWAGKARNCVYSRADSVISGRSEIYFIEKAGKLEYTCEVNTRETKKTKTVVFQEIKNRNNRSLTKEEEKLCSDLLSAVVKK